MCVLYPKGGKKGKGLTSFCLFPFFILNTEFKKSHSEGDKTTETEKGTKTSNDLVPKRSNQDILKDKRHIMASLISLTMCGEVGGLNTNLCIISCSPCTVL